MNTPMEIITIFFGLIILCVSAVIFIWIKVMMETNKILKSIMNDLDKEIKRLDDKITDKIRGRKYE